MRSYYLYKGLKKPLVFFGLKDKYIYYALGTGLGGFIFVAILSTLFGIIGTFSAFGLTGGSIYMIFKIQDKKGLYNKPKDNNQLYVIQKRIK